MVEGGQGLFLGGSGHVLVKSPVSALWFVCVCVYSYLIGSEDNLAGLHNFKGLFEC